MNKIFYVVTVAILFASALYSQEMHQDENPFMNYYEDQTTENLIKAIEHFAKQDDEAGIDKRIMLGNLYLIALEKEIGSLETDLDSLVMRDKFQYANLLLALNRYDESISLYEDLNSTAPNWSCPWRHKGEAYFKSERLEQAEAALKKAVETRVEHYDAYVMLADVQNDMGKPEEALKTLETGFSYLGKDIEDPDEEVNDLDVKFLHLELLRKNGRQEEYDKLKMKIQEIAPEDERLKAEM